MEVRRPAREPVWPIDIRAWAGPFGRNRLLSAQSRVVSRPGSSSTGAEPFARRRSPPMSPAWSTMASPAAAGGRPGYSMPPRTVPTPGFGKRGQDDRHQLRFVVTPDDAGDMTDLTAFTRT